MSAGQLTRNDGDDDLEGTTEPERCAGRRTDGACRWGIRHETTAMTTSKGRLSRRDALVGAQTVRVGGAFDTKRRR